MSLTTLASLPPEMTIRAALLQSGLVTLDSLGPLLLSLQLDPMRPLASFPAAELANIAAACDPIRKPPSATSPQPSPWDPFLDRTRALVYRYALLHRPLEWDPQHSDESLARWLTRFIASEGLDLTSRQRLGQLEPHLETSPLSPDPEAMATYQELLYVFSLSPVEEDLLWLYLGPSFAPELQWIYDALTRSASFGAMPTRLAEEILRLAPERPREEVAAALEPTATLRRLALLENAAGHEFLRAAPRIVKILTTRRIDAAPEQLAGLARFDRPQAPSDTDQILSALHPDLPARLRRWLRQKRKRFIVQGPKGAGAATLARIIAGTHSLAVATIRLDTLLSASENELRAVLREVTLQRSLLLLTHVDTLNRPDLSPQVQERTLLALRHLNVPTLFDVGPSLATDLLFLLMDRLDAVAIHLQLPALATRDLIWKWALHTGQEESKETARPLDVPKARLPKLINKVHTFPLGTDQIVAAVRLGQLYTLQLDDERQDIDPQAMLRACQALLGHRLGEVAARVETRHRWEDLILSADVQEQIAELIAFGRLSKKVLEEWGFGARLSYGKGLTALFSGPSGTGKTMVAGLIARELGMDLYRIDLSRMVSKYIGETEKQLAMLFDEARASGCALLFDEADSLFGKRTEVSSSTDRYANLEVNFLLQQVEEHPGVVLLTSNFPQSIDEAFMRRLRFRIDFPRPEASERAAMWGRMIAKEAPQDADLKLQALADHYELSGGEIRNAVLRAALYAAGEDRRITAQDLERSARAEYRQLGRLVPIQRKAPPGGA